MQSKFAAVQGRSAAFDRAVASHIVEGLFIMGVPEALGSTSIMVVAHSSHTWARGANSSVRMRRSISRR